MTLSLAYSPVELIEVAANFIPRKWTQDNRSFDHVGDLLQDQTCPLLAFLLNLKQVRTLPLLDLVAQDGSLATQTQDMYTPNLVPERRLPVDRLEYTSRGARGDDRITHTFHFELRARETGVIAPDF